MAHAPLMIRALRNRESKTMNVSRDDLYRLIVEEYVKEEGLELAEDRADDLLAWIKGGKKPDDLEYDKTVPDPPEIPGGELGPDSDTYPMDIPRDDAPEDEYQGFQNDSGAPAEEQLAALIQGMDPEAVSELFQSVFEKIPGVEIGDAEEDPETLYSPGAEGRPVAGFQLEELMGLIREVISETKWYDLSDPETRPPPHSTATEEEPDSYEKLTAAYHALEDVLGQYPHLQDAFDSVANVLDAMDAGDARGERADESLKEEWGSAGDCVANSTDKRVKKAAAKGAERVLVFDPDCNLMNPEEIDATLADLEAGVSLDDLHPPEMY
jgi:hypothetical protein